MSSTTTQSSEKGESLKRQTAISRMNQVLANEFGVFTKTLNYHWNVTGPRFHSIHTFLGEHYEQLLKIMDDLAERTRVIGGRPIGTVKDVEKVMELKEASPSISDASEMIKDLMYSHREIKDQISETLEEIEDWSFDPGTEDFLTNLLRQHEKMAWMLRSHLH